MHTNYPLYYTPFPSGALVFRSARYATLLSYAAGSMHPRIPAIVNVCIVYIIRLTFYDY